jgi:hypothetical protein
LREAVGSGSQLLETVRHAYGSLDHQRLSPKPNLADGLATDAICDPWEQDELHSRCFARMMLVARIAAQRGKIGEPENEGKAR